MKQPEISCRQSAAMRSAKERLVSGWLRIWRRQKLQNRLSGTTVSVVLTSCGRPDLLIRTLDSFFRFNTYPVSQFIVVEMGRPCWTFFSLTLFHARTISSARANESVRSLRSTTPTRE